MGLVFFGLSFLLCDAMTLAVTEWTVVFAITDPQAHSPHPPTEATLIISS